MILTKIILCFFKGSKGLSSLKKLEILDISGNKFDKSVIKSLGAITSLKTLVLRSIDLNGSFPIQGMSICLYYFSKIKFTIFLAFNVP